jgi:hypothetical protein
MKIIKKGKRVSIVDKYGSIYKRKLAKDNRYKSKYKVTWYWKIDFSNECVKLPIEYNNELESEFKLLYRQEKLERILQ